MHIAEARAGVDLSSGAAIPATLHALAADEARFIAALVAEARPYFAPIKAFDLWIVVIAARKQFSFSAHPNSGRFICIAVIYISSYDHIHVHDPCIWRNLLLIP
jgi:hypothetical protein